MRGFYPLFFGICEKNKLLTNLFTFSGLLKEHNFDAFTIDLNYINGKFNSVIKR